MDCFGTSGWTNSLKLTVFNSSSVYFEASNRLVFAKEIFSFFIPEEETINFGVSYLKIMAYSQIFMCIELTTAGAFNGISKTMPPSIISISFNALRIPMAFYFSKVMGIDGIWWAITISSILKGLILYLWFAKKLKKGIIA